MSVDSGNSNDIEDVHCAIQAVVRGGQRTIGACVRRRASRASDVDKTQWTLELYDFLDNDQYSNLDCFLVQIGVCIILISDDLGDNSKADNRKIGRILESRAHTKVETVKKQFFKKVDTSDVISRLVGRENHETTVAEVPYLANCVLDMCLVLIIDLHRWSDR